MTLQTISTAISTIYSLAVFTLVIILGRISSANKKLTSKYKK